jgi:hypothetical protein
VSEIAPCWTIAKDAMSFLGAVSLAVPWIVDYFVRRRRRSAENLPTKLRIKDELVRRYDRVLIAPKRRDLILTAGGIGLLTISYSIALLQSLGILAS